MNDMDKLVSARSCNRDISEDPPKARQNCSVIVNFTLFFDGTGNNKYVDKAKKSWSNPTRLWQAAQMLTDMESPNYTVYITGVGTPFNGTATDWMDQKLMDLQDNATGGIAGGGGRRRIEHGQSSVNDQLRAVLVRNAAKLELSLKPYLAIGKPENLTGLAAALEAHGFITILNLSIFGFSRGAALARAFSNEMLRTCVTGEDGIVRYCGVPLRIHFMGLFDTVASFGVPALNVDVPFLEKNLVVPQAVERCVHYIAAHELRFSFPLDLIRKNGALKPHWVEAVYPGVHSDVGGGYEPLCQNIPNSYSRIPMRDMMREAVRSGVRLADYDDICKADRRLFELWFEIDPKIEAVYKQYMAAIGTPASVELAIVAHMKALYSAWGTMTRRKIKTPDLLEGEARSRVKNLIGHPGIAREAELLLNDRKAAEYFLKKSLAPGSADYLQIQGMRYRMIVRPEKWRLDAWQTTAPDAILNFIQSCVHDSKGAFVLSVEPFSYFRPRGMAESTRNVLAQGLDWLDRAGARIDKGIIKIYHKAKQVIVETWEEGKLIATRTYRVGEKFVIATAREGVKYTVEVYQTGKQIVISTIKTGEQIIVTSVDLARKGATALGDAAQETGEAAVEIGHRVRDGASDAASAFGQKVDEHIKNVEDGWQAARAGFGL
jgi:hypothetical protein